MSMISFIREFRMLLTCQPVQASRRCDLHTLRGAGPAIQRRH
jgi:hypothetical protein